MSDEPKKGQPLPGVHSDGTGRALSHALQKTFESLLQEQVPDRFKELIARLRAEEEARNASKGNDPES